MVNWIWIVNVGLVGVIIGIFIGYFRIYQIMYKKHNLDLAKVIKLNFINHDVSVEVDKE